MPRLQTVILDTLRLSSRLIGDVRWWERRRCSVHRRWLIPDHLAQPDALKAEVAKILLLMPKPQVVRAMVSPHTVFGYSGAVAGAVYARFDCPAVFLIRRSNHRGMGEPLALMGDGEWEIPLGTVAIEQGVATALRSACLIIRDDAVAHGREHSLEVQLPFLQRLGTFSQILPLILGAVSYEFCQELAHGIAHTVRRTNRAVVVIASTDMTHCGHRFPYFPPAGMTTQPCAYQEDLYAI